VDEADLSIIIPTLNEEENIEMLCNKIGEIIPKSKIIVVDDGSKDNTQNIVRSLMKDNELISLIDRGDEVIKGLSISIQDGIKACKTDYFMNIDGDLQHPPEYLKDAVECFKISPDLVIGYRTKVENWPFQRKLISWGAQLLGRFTLFLRRRQHPKDIMSGFFGGRVEYILALLEDANIAYKGYKFLFDILKVFPKDGKIEQFGYVFRNREYGTSKIGKAHMWEFFKSLL
jgi:glycosyltransferase involved in cell wall biosynthesis